MLYKRGKVKINLILKKYLDEVNKFAPGEVLIQSIDRDGTLWF